MNSRGREKLLSACLTGLLIATQFSHSIPSAIGSELTTPIPMAACGPRDRTESVQGQTTLAERFNAGPTRTYNCNLELVGQFSGEGAGADVEAFDDCAYYTTAPNPKMKHPGVVILDVADSRAPKPITYLASPAMLNAHESLEVSKTRQLLLGSSEPSRFDIYDISNCRRPVLKSSVTLAGDLVSHSGQFTTDGLTFYGAKWDPKDPKVFALDVSDPASPHSIAIWIPPNDNAGWITHSIIVNKDSTRAYLSLKSDGR